MKTNKKSILAVTKIFRHFSSGSSYFTCKAIIYDNNFNIIDIVKIPYTYGYGSQPEDTTKNIIAEKFTSYNIVYSFSDLGYRSKKKCNIYQEG